MQLLHRNSWQGRIPFLLPWPKQIEIDGVLILLRSAPMTPHMKRRLVQGGYESAERKLIRRFVRPGDRVLEIGASLGIVSCFIGKQIGDSGMLVCVEPDARLANHFWRQLGINGLQASLVNALCCPTWEGSVPESLAKRHFAPSMNNLTGIVTEDAGTNREVPWLTAEEICNLEHLAPSTVVVDIEGTERIWGELPPCFPPPVETVIVEIHPAITGAEQAAQALQAVLSEGFRVVAFAGSVFAFQR